MSQIFDEDFQHIDPATNTLLVGGKIYIGTVGLDPKTNEKDVFDNRELTGAALGQPIIIGSDGRASSKMWVSGKYSMTIDSSADVQKFQELDNGVVESVGNIQTENSLGVNDITATGTTTQTAYVDNESYIVTAPANNTGAMTINIDSIGVIDIKKAHDQAIESGDVLADMKLVMVYNSTDGWMELQSAVLGSVFSQITVTGTAKYSKGADVASATALTLGSDGNYFDITGTTTITSINTVSVGTVIKLHLDAALTLTHHATDLILPGASNITTAAGDEAEFVEYATGDWRCTNYQLSDSQLLKTKIIEIGDWDMDTTITLTVAHGLTLSAIRSISVLIRNDLDTNSRIFPIPNTAATSVEQVVADSTNISLVRATGGTFDNTTYDSTSYNRGWITIQYTN